MVLNLLYLHIFMNFEKIIRYIFLLELCLVNMAAYRLSLIFSEILIIWKHRIMPSRCKSGLDM
jgi:hypothetical protein